MGFWALGIGHWSLVLCHWSLGIGHWSLVIGHWSLGDGGDGGDVQRPDFSRYSPVMADAITGAI